MRGLHAAVIVGACLVAGCAGGSERQWMKVNQRYTVQEFRRDHAECSRGGKLDEVCLRRRGWVDVTELPTKQAPGIPADPRWRQGP